MAKFDAVAHINRLANADRLNRIQPRREAIAPAHVPLPKQREFIDSPADIALFGGAAGGGKSAALLIDFAKDRLRALPGYSSVIFRRTYPMIRNEGGLWDESSNFYPAIGGTPLESRLEWKFPTGSTIRFAHLQHDKNRFDWQGAQLCRIGFDELTHFSEEQFWYLLGRARTTLPITPQVRATCNPDAESWVADFIDWWIDADGFAIPERSGVLRWFVRAGGEIKWGDTPEELGDRYPDLQPKSFTFIPATLTDNPILLANDPGYLANLQAQHPVERARLLYGNWRIKADAGLVFNRQWFAIADTLPVITGRMVRFWDLAATAREVSSSSTFYTASVKGMFVEGKLWILDATWHQVSAGEVSALLVAIAQQDGRNVAIRWELEGGSSGRQVEAYLKRELAGFNAAAIAPQGDKVSRAMPVATMASAGNVVLLRAPWNDTVLNCYQSFDGAPRPLTNDIVDCTSGLYSVVVAGNVAIEAQYAGAKRVGAGLFQSKKRGRYR